MGRDRTSKAAGKHHRTKRGLSVVEREGWLHIQGTITVRGESIRVRKSTGLDSATPENWDRAEEIIRKTEGDIQDQVIHGVKPTPLFAELVEQYLQNRDPGPSDLRSLEELLDRFGNMRVAKIDKTKIDRFYRERFPAHSPATIRRHQRTLSAVFNFAVQDELIDHVPYFSKPKVRKKKGSNINKKFLPGEAELIIDCAETHLKPILAVLLSTGARVAMTLKLSKEHFILVRTRGRVTFPESKNGNAYRRPLHDYTVQVLKDWLKTRNDSHPEMFLTPKNQPFVIHKGQGGQIERSYNRARNQAVEILIQRGSIDRARVVAKSTPHWFRHSFANTLRQDFKADVKTIMEAGMWESEKVLLDNYFGDTHEQTDAVVKSIPVGTKLTQKDADEA